MAIEFQCEHCNTTLRVSDEHAGKRAKCPKCQAVNLIQAGGQASQSEFATPGGIQSPLSSPEADAQESYFDGDSAAASKAVANPYSASNVGAMGGYNQAHRGSMILTLGILSLVCNVMLVPGIMAWILGRADIKEMDAGRMDPEGRGMTTAGMVLGIIGTVLPLLAIALYIVFIVIVFVFVGAAAAAG